MRKCDRETDKLNKKVMMSSRYFVAVVHFDENQLSLVKDIESLAIDHYGCQGIEEFALEESEVDEILGERAYSGGDIPTSVLTEVEEVTNAHGACYKYYFYDEGCDERAREFVAYLATNFQALKTQTLEEEWQDWNSEWRKHYRPLEISPELFVVPEWNKDEFAREKSVYIYPGMGFGTGDHETTYLCLKFLEKLNAEKTNIESCLDFGCGSGILGIAAIRRQKSLVDFCDIDKSALENTLQNLELNFLESELNGHRLVIRERFAVEKKYDLVFANILENILLLERETIIDSVKEGGHLIVSGLLNDQVQTIIDDYEKSGLKTLETSSKGDWSSILFKR